MLAKISLLLFLKDNIVHFKDDIFHLRDNILILKYDIFHFLETLSETGEGARGGEERRFCACGKCHELRREIHCCKGCRLFNLFTPQKYYFWERKEQHNVVFGSIILSGGVGERKEV